MSWNCCADTMNTHALCLCCSQIRKLTYLQMLGYDMSWAAFYVIEVSIRQAASTVVFNGVGFKRRRHKTHTHEHAFVTAHEYLVDSSKQARRSGDDVGISLPRLRNTNSSITCKTPKRA